MRPMIVLTGDRACALGIYALARLKTLEFDQDFEMPDSAEFSASTMPRFPRSHDRFFSEGGTHAPDRWLFNLRAG